MPFLKWFVAAITWLHLCPFLEHHTHSALCKGPLCMFNIFVNVIQLSFLLSRHPLGKKGQVNFQTWYSLVNEGIQKVLASNSFTLIPYFWMHCVICNTGHQPWLLICLLSSGSPCRTSSWSWFSRPPPVPHKIFWSDVICWLVTAFPLRNWRFNRKRADQLNRWKWSSVNRPTKVSKAM